MILTKLGAVTLIEDEDDAFVAQRLQPFFVGGFAFLFMLLGFFAGFVQRQAQLLDGGDDHLVGIVLGQQSSYKRFGVGVFFHTAFLKAVEFLTGLAVEVFAIHHEQTFFNVRVVLEQGGSLEGGQRFAAAEGLPGLRRAVLKPAALRPLVRFGHRQSIAERA